MQRMMMMIKIKPEKIEEYKKLHANAWPEILAQLSSSNITNYSIFLREPENLLVGYWEYIGEDFEADMQKISAHPMTKKWWSFTDPCQEVLDSHKPGEWWSMMEEVFHNA